MTGTLADVLRADGRRGRSLARRATALSATATVCANLVGAITVFVLLVWVLPTPDDLETAEVVIDNLIWTVIFCAVMVPLMTVTGVRSARRRLRWLVEERTPTSAERRSTLRIPVTVTVRQMSAWLLAAAVFGLYDGLRDVLLGVEVGVTVLIGGLTTAAVTYLLAESFARPLLPYLFHGAAVRRRPGAGITWRTLMIWGLCTGLPVAGTSLLAGLALGIDMTVDDLALAVFVLGLTALAEGLLAMMLYARSLTAPLRSLRGTIERVEQGQLDLRVPVTSTTEVGVLQAAVNRMVEGLRERERVRELFGQHVGEDVARRALDEGVELGGEVRDVAALFIDVTESTALAQQLDPERLLQLLNDLFAVVVEVVDEHGGLVNKFIGDAALAIWGAPLAHADPSAAALAAAVELGRRLPDEVPSLDVGIGVAAGPVVAGNLGADRRLEYTVIGDAVNVASRLSTVAKTVTGRVLATASMVDGAGEGSPDGWLDAGQTVLRGRSAPTALVAPASLRSASGRATAELG